MKKIIFKAIIFISGMILFFASCAVNSNTGVITISNPTDIPLSNVRIGSLLVASYLAPGAKVDYWIFQPVTGALTFTGNFNYPDYYKKDNTGNTDYNNIKNLKDISLEFDLGFWHQINTFIGKLVNDTENRYYISVTSTENNKSQTDYNYNNYNTTDGYGLY